MKSRVFGILILLALFFAFIPLHAQTRSVTLHKDNITVSELLSALEKQTGYTFAYKTSDIDLSDVVDTDVEGEDVLSVLRQVLSSQNLNFTVSGTRIVVSKRKTEESSVPE